MKRWYAVYTKAGQERIAEGNLRAQGFETHLPRIAVRRKNRRAVSTVVVPMFPRYLFVRLDVAAGPWRSVNGTFGVVSLVSFGERPAPIPDPVMDELIQRADNDGVVRLADADSLQPGDKVEFMDGPMAEVGAMFSARTDSERVIVLMSLMGRQVPVTVPGEQLRRAS